MPQKKNFKPVVACAVVAFLLASFPILGNETSIDFDASASIDWRRGEISAQTSFSLAQAGLRLPSGRLMGEDILQRAWPRLFRPYLLSIRVDSSSTLADLVERGDLSLQALDSISRAARKTPPSLSPDMSRMIGRYAVSIEEISALLITHGRAAEPLRPLVPVPALDYTGIIIIADRSLPVRGREGSALVQPSLFPRIWDTNMNLIYDRNMTEPPPLGSSARIVRYAAPENIFRPTPSGLEGDLAALAGPRPLRVFAREVFGAYPTDPVIDHSDALRILSNDNNRRLLREGRVVLVLSAEMVIK